MILNATLCHLELNGATWALLGVIVGALATGIINYLLQRAQFKHNREMFLLQNKSKEQVKEIILDLLNHRVHTDRSFEAIHKRIGGYSEDEIRQLLHEVGARKVSDGTRELWYLKDREDERKKNSSSK